MSSIEVRTFPMIETTTLEAAGDVPHDPAVLDGVLRFASLRPQAQRAWRSRGL